MSSVDLDELVEHWTVLEDERTLVDAKRGAARLGFALLLKLYTRHGRFPIGGSELPGEVVEYVSPTVPAKRVRARKGQRGIGHTVLGCAGLRALGDLKTARGRV